MCLRRGNGEMVYNPKGIEEMFLSLFKEIFNYEHDMRGRALMVSMKKVAVIQIFFRRSLCWVCKFQSNKERNWMLRFTGEEVRKAVFQMGRSKALGPNGFVAGFYQMNKLGGQGGV